MVGFAATPILANPNGQGRPIPFGIRRAVRKEILSARAMVLLPSDLGYVWFGRPFVFIPYRTDTCRTIVDTIVFLCDTNVSGQVVHRVGIETQYVP